jgi:heme A synthase
MVIFKLQVSNYAIDLQTYFGDVYLYHRTWMLALGLVAVLLVTKMIRKRNIKPVADTTTDVWG